MQSQFQTRKVATALSLGARRGSLGQVKLAVESRGSVNGPDVRGVTPLMFAARARGAEAAQVMALLLQHGAAVGARDRRGWTAMHHACRNGRGEAIRSLQWAGGDPGALTDDWRTCLMLATMEGDLDIVLELLTNKPVRAQVTLKDAVGTTALHLAVRDGFVLIAKKLLDKNAVVNAADKDGVQPLMVACQCNRLDCVKLLCSRKAEVHVVCKQRRSALLHACIFMNEQVAIWLVLKRAADPMAEDMNGDTPLSVADDHGLLRFKLEVKHSRADIEDI